jgi:3-oxoacyl-[acyl-carrier-protein] synthase II
MLGEAALTQRVVLTGLGPLCSLGQRRDVFWDNITAGRSGVVVLPELADEPVALAAPVELLDAAGRLGPRERRFDRVAQFALLAAQSALCDAGLENEARKNALKPERAGVVLGTSRGAASQLEAAFERFGARGRTGVGPHVSPYTTTGSLSAIVGRHFGFKGFNLTVSAACSSASQAIGVAFDRIRLGREDVMLAGGAEACLTPFCLAMLDAAGILSHRNAEPAGAVRPFDSDRDGIVVGEGAGVLVLESEAHARARGAESVCELRGFGGTCDAHSLTGIPADGDGLARAIGLALDDAQLDKASVDYVNAHGTATQVGDRAETAALKGALGETARRVAISSTKSMTGHLLGAVGGIEAIICALALQEGVVPPTINLDRPDPACDLDYVPRVARPLAAHVALSTSMGFGGNNACLVFARADA